MTLAGYLTLPHPRPPFRMGKKGRVVWHEASRDSVRANGYHGIRRDVVRISRYDHKGRTTACREFSDQITLISTP